MEKGTQCYPTAVPEVTHGAGAGPHGARGWPWQAGMDSGLSHDPRLSLGRYLLS